MTAADGQPQVFQGEVSNLEKMKCCQIRKNKSEKIDHGVVNWSTFVVQAQKFEPLKLKTQKLLIISFFQFFLNVEENQFYVILKVYTALLLKNDTLS